MRASACEQTDVVRELIAADGSVEHLRMKDINGKTALNLAKKDEIRQVLLTAARGV